LVVTGADVPVFAYAGEDVILNCSVDTHVPLGELEVEWMKTNEEIQVLLFMEGRYRPESQPERFRGRAEFFSEEIPKGNFSMKLRDVKTEDRGEFMCIVHTDRESINATAYVQELGGNRSTQRKPTQTRGQHANSAQRGPGQRGFKPRTSLL
ncbi:hypothetical protein COCON_G00171620, partial [Conger conger]